MLPDLLQTLFTRVAVIPLGMITGILTARYLGPTSRGVLTIFLLFPHTVRAFCTMGLDTASIYFHRKQKVPFAVLFANCLAFGTIVGSLVAAGLWLGRDRLPGEAFEDAGPLFLIALATVPPIVLYQYLGSLARAVGLFSVSNVRSVIEKGLDVGAVVLIFFVFHGGVLAYLVSHFVIMVTIVLWLCWDLRSHIRGKLVPDLRILGRMLKFGAKTSAQGIASTAHYRADVFLVAAFLTKADIAFYAIGAGLAERSLMIADVMGTVLLPRLTSADDRQAAALLCARACRNTLFLGFLMALALCLSGRPLVLLLYGRDYLPAVVPMYVLVAGVLMVGVTRILMRYLTSLDVHQHNAYIVGVSAVINVALNLWLIPRYGILGAAVSSLCTYSLQGVWALWLFSRFSGLPVRTALLVSREDLDYLRALPTRLSLRHVAPATR